MSVVRSDETVTRLLKNVRLLRCASTPLIRSTVVRLNRAVSRALHPDAFEQPHSLKYFNSLLTGCPGYFITTAALLFLLWGLASTFAQDTTHREWRDASLLPERIPNGIAYDDFPIGAYQYHYNFGRPVEELWSYYTNLEVDFVIFNVLNHYDNAYRFDHFRRYQRFLDAAPPGKSAVLNIAYSPSLIVEASNSREVVLYPFDSSQMRVMGEYEHLFTQFQSDSTRFNPDPANTPYEGSGPRESVYSPADSGAIIASRILYNREPGRIYRFPQYEENGEWRDRPGDSTADIDAFLRDRPTDNPQYYVGLKGHLFYPLSPGARDTDSLIRINVMYEVPRGVRYVDSFGLYKVAEQNLRLQYTTLWVELQDLVKREQGGDDKYQHVSLPLRLDFCEDCRMPGPLFEGNESRRFDLEVVYLGKERLAVRSLALRDSIMETLQGKGPSSEEYRRNVLSEIDMLVNDSASGRLRDEVFAIYTADEFPSTRYAGLREVERLQKQNYRRESGDSLASWTTLLIPYGQHLADLDWLGRESYFNPHLPLPGYDKFYRIKYAMVPSLKQHNGGRWGIPEFFDMEQLGDPEYDATMPERIADMEDTWQRVFLGTHTPYPQAWPYNVTAINNMGADARRARKMGRRIATLIGPNSQLTIAYDNQTGERDTTANHRFERSELRCLTNLAVAYGSKSIVWYEQNGYPWMGVAPDGGPVGNIPVMGFGGLSVADTVNDRYDWILRRPGIEDSIGLVRDYFLGFASTYNQIRETGQWLHRVGPRLATLRWRDGYSAHWRVRRPGNSSDESRQPRPLPPDEIVTDVRARHPITGVADSAWNTFVELGLFETTTGVSNGERDYAKDTNHIVVVNRRVFETYDTIDLQYSPSAKALMDSLTESRTISLTLNLTPPIILERPGMIRIREIAPDTARLPLIGRRSVLDTIVASGIEPVIVELTLGPGRASLLELTFEPDNEFLRSVLWPGRREE